MIVPADGVKGKTWGPSSGGHVLNSLGGLSSSKSRPAIPEERWSQSVSSLEKSSSSRNKSGMPSVTSVPEIGKYNIFYTNFFPSKNDSSMAYNNTLLQKVLTLDN